MIIAQPLQGVVVEVLQSCPDLKHVLKFKKGRESL